MIQLSNPLAAASRSTLFQGGVQRAGLGGAGVDADADQRMAAHPAQHKTVGLVCMGLVIPDPAGIFACFQSGQLLCIHILVPLYFDRFSYRT